MHLTADNNRKEKKEMDKRIFFHEKKNRFLKKKIGSKSICYCPYCKTITTLGVPVTKYSYKCDYCGVKFTSDDIFTLVGRIYTEYTMTQEVTVVTKEDDKIIIATNFKLPITITDSNKVIWDSIWQRIVINTKTGFSYLLPLRSEKTNKLVVVGTRNRNGLMQISLNALNEYGIQYWFNIDNIEVYKYVGALLDVQVEETAYMSMYSGRILQALCMANYYRMHNVNIYDVYQLSLVIKHLNLKQVFKQKRGKIENIHTLTIATILQYFGFKNKDVCKTLHKYFDTNYTSLVDFVTYIDDTKFYFESMITAKSENAVSKMLINTVSLQDKDFTKYREVTAKIVESSIMWRNLYNRHKVRDLSLLQGNIHESHDLLSLTLKKIDEPCLMIEYTEQIAQLYNHTTINGYEIMLANTTHELLDCGHYLRNCVGIYDHATLNKHCYILFIKKDGKYKAAIELRNDLSLNQCKKFANKPLDGELAEVAYEWFKQHPEINTAKCIDYYSLINNLGISVDNK